MILSFKDRETEKIWNRNISKKFPIDIQRIARRKLIQLDGSTSINDLKIPPGNRLHALTGDRKGQYTISINMQFRICFTWNNGNASDVEIVDYH
jgi:proteic killer suppression protein